MLIIVRNSGTSNDYTLEQFRKMYRVPIDMTDVSYFTATGDELNHIKNQYKRSMGNVYDDDNYTIPFKNNASSMTWYGDIARTILANL